MPRNIRQIALAQGSGRHRCSDHRWGGRPALADAGRSEDAARRVCSISRSAPTPSGACSPALDTGDDRRIPACSAFVSYSNNRADNWRGAGFDTRQHVDAKLLGEWGDGNRASIAVSFNDADIRRSIPAPTQADWKAYGRGYQFRSSTTVTGTSTTGASIAAPFRNVYVSAPVHLKLSDQARRSTTPVICSSATAIHRMAPNSPPRAIILGAEELAQADRASRGRAMV